MKLGKLFVLIPMLLVAFCATAVLAGPVVPWNDTGFVLDVQRNAATGAASSAMGSGLQSGADHIVGQQCGDGGFGWPHSDCSATYANITGPICLGIMDAYAYSGDAAHLAAATSGGAFDLTSTYTTGEWRFGTGTPHFLWRLSMLTGDAQYQTHAEVNFFDALDAGTYGTGPYDTAGWIGLVEGARSGSYVNLRPWEFQTLVHTATAIGNAGQDALFLQAVLDGLDTLDMSDPGNVWWDTLGLAGGVRGVALSGTTTFAAIASPNHTGINGISTLDDLAAALVSFQNGDGSWNWAGDLSSLGGATEGDKDTQTTAYAVLALVAADPLVATDYSGAITAGRTWLLGIQQGDGGFLSYPGGGENTEVEGEALSAISGPTGACCSGATCDDLPESECIIASGSFLGEGTMCEGDSDGDGVDGECGDGCPDDINKIVPGICGCGVADTDSDGDGTPDCSDGCPGDGSKTSPGICGCGVSDIDTDGDGTADCNDPCPSDPEDACHADVPAVSTWGILALLVVVLVLARLNFGLRRKVS